MRVNLKSTDFIVCQFLVYLSSALLLGVVVLSLYSYSRSSSGEQSRFFVPTEMTSSDAKKAYQAFKTRLWKVRKNIQLSTVK